MEERPNPRRPRILGAPVDPVDSAILISDVLRWARARESRYVCFANAHMVMEACDDPGFRAVLEAADFVMPDGKPLVWMLRRMGWPRQEHVRGPGAMRALFGAAEREGLTVGFLGSTPSVLSAMVERAAHEYPGLGVVYMHSPPFRATRAGEDDAVLAAIERAGVQLLFVGLGCPKQERWMHAHRGRFRGVMFGVGAGFDFYAGRFRECPPVLSRLGLEGFYRTFREPRRLGSRNLRIASRFALRALRQLCTQRSAGG